MYKFKGEYRIREHTGTFDVQGLYEVSQKRTLFKKGYTKEEWHVLDHYGYRWVYFEYVPSRPIARYKTLDKAKSAVKMFKRGEVIHDV